MIPETAFLLAVYLVPLALVSGLSACVDNRRPLLGGVLLAGSLGLMAWVWATRPEGLFGFRDIPDLTIMFVAQVIALF